MPSLCPFAFACARFDPCSSDIHVSSRHVQGSLLGSARTDWLADGGSSHQRTLPGVHAHRTPPGCCLERAGEPILTTSRAHYIHLKPTWPSMRRPTQHYVTTTLHYTTLVVRSEVSGVMTLHVPWASERTGAALSSVAALPHSVSAPRLVPASRVRTETLTVSVRPVAPSNPCIICRRCSTLEEKRARLLASPPRLASRLACRRLYKYSSCRSPCCPSSPSRSRRREREEIRQSSVCDHHHRLFLTHLAGCCRPRQRRRRQPCVPCPPASQPRAAPLASARSRTPPQPAPGTPRSRPSLDRP